MIRQPFYICIQFKLGLQQIRFYLVSITSGWAESSLRRWPFHTNRWSAWERRFKINQISPTNLNFHKTKTRNNQCLHLVATRRSSPQIRPSSRCPIPPLRPRLQAQAETSESSGVCLSIICSQLPNPKSPSKSAPSPTSLLPPPRPALDSSLTTKAAFPASSLGLAPPAHPSTRCQRELSSVTCLLSAGNSSLAHCRRKHLCVA